MAASSRIAALSGVAGIALFDVGWFWDPAPSVDLSTRRLDAYLSTHSTTSWLIVSALQLLAVPFLWRFSGALRDRLAAGGAAPWARRTAHAAAKAFAITVLVFGLLYASVPIGGVFGTGMPPGAIYLFVAGATFSLFIMASTLCVLAMVVAVVAAAFRGRAVPLGLGIAGIPLGLAVLANVVLPMSGITLWFVVAGIVLAVSRPATVATTPELSASRPTPSLPLGVPTL